MKLALLGAWGAGAPASARTADAAAAADAEPAPAVAAGSPTSRVRELLAALERRQAELDERERDLEARAARVRLLEEDVTAKLGALEAIEQRLAGAAKARRTSAAESAESLGKIYAAMKPAQAAPILDRLDERTILTIFGRMKEKQVGEILPLMSRERAIVLTEALAARP
jgi:flagellar motility protein MotE (MotC chaperone)